MNPIERALAKADKIQAANRALEAGRSPDTRPVVSGGRNPKRAVVGDSTRPTTGARTVTLGQHLAGMKGGETREFGVNDSGDRFHVTYRDRPSYGDNNFKVPGATVGEYTVIRQPANMTAPKLVAEHPHGPHANTDAARRMGANPNAKWHAANAAAETLVRMGAQAQQRAMMRSGAAGTEAVFRDRRSGAPMYDHPDSIGNDFPGQAMHRNARGDDVYPNDFT